MGASGSSSSGSGSEAGQPNVDPKLLAEFTESALFQQHVEAHAKQKSASHTEPPLVESESEARARFWDDLARRARTTLLPLGSFTAMGVFRGPGSLKEAAAEPKARVAPPPEPARRVSVPVATAGQAEFDAAVGCIGRSSPSASQDDEMAARLFRSASFHGHAEAMAGLGACYARGWGGCRQSMALAQYWYGRAAALGVARAQHNMALWALREKPAEAYEYMLSAALGGHRTALACVATRFAAELQGAQFGDAVAKARADQAMQMARGLSEGEVEKAAAGMWPAHAGGQPHSHLLLDFSLPVK